MPAYTEPFMAPPCAEETANVQFLRPACHSSRDSHVETVSVPATAIRLAKSAKLVHFMKFRADADWQRRMQTLQLRKEQSQALQVLPTICPSRDNHQCIQCKWAGCINGQSDDCTLLVQPCYSILHISVVFTDKYKYYFT